MATTNQLPFLPGYRVDIDKKDRYHKTHFFDVQNSTRIDNSHAISISASQPPIAAQPSTVQSIQAFHNTLPTATTTMSRLPAWVAYDRKVLRFYGFFKESVHSSPQETWRVRKCVIYLYLEDESIHIAEPKIENSGIPQGVFVKRHRIPRTGGEGTYGVEDLKVGAEIVVYGRVFRLVDADAFTRDFYAHNGMPLSSPESYPLDAFTLSSTSKPTTFNKLMHPHKQYMEASLGKPMLPSAQATQQFLQMDGHVLRFYAQWDDEKMYGEKKPYVIHYYLADDTVEVQEIQQPNSGRDPFPTLLKRQKLAKNWVEAVPNVARLGLKHEELTTEYYTKEDFRIGASIYVYGRQLLICGADESTKNYYSKNYGLTEADFRRINMEDPEEEIARLTPPPYNGYGTEEDSLGSFLYLMPKVPKADFKKLMQNDGINLRFLAKLIQPCSKVDRERRFIVTFYCASDQLSLFEKFDRNSGFIGGKFLEKSRLKNPATGEWFKASDFYVGARVKINAYEFEICEEDEFTRKWTVQTSPHSTSSSSSSQFAATVPYGDESKFQE